jgi:hypothetical protein
MDPRKLHPGTKKFAANFYSAKSSQYNPREFLMIKLKRFPKKIKGTSDNEIK